MHEACQCLGGLTLPCSIVAPLHLLLVQSGLLAFGETWGSVHDATTPNHSRNCNKRFPLSVRTGTSWNVFCKCEGGMGGQKAVLHCSVATVVVCQLPSTWRCCSSASACTREGTLDSS